MSPWQKHRLVKVREEPKDGQLLGDEVWKRPENVNRGDKILANPTRED